VRNASRASEKVTRSSVWWEEPPLYLRAMLQVAERGSAHVMRDPIGNLKLVLVHGVHDLSCTIVEGRVRYISWASRDSVLAHWFWWECEFVSVMDRLRKREDLRSFFLALEM